MALFSSSLFVLVSLPTLLVARSKPTFYDPARVSQLSWRPRCSSPTVVHLVAVFCVSSGPNLSFCELGFCFQGFFVQGFLSHGDCDHLIKLAKGKLEKSMVADNESGDSVASDVRTSSGMFLAKHQDDIVVGIEQRIAAWTFLPEENGEAIQILHYENGQKYDAHFDYFHDKNNRALGGHRVATVLMYLSDVNKGGETVFPNAEGKLSQYKDETWSECARSGYAVKPKKGDALLFFSLHVDATTDPSSLHMSCPVIEGEKWSATKWIHVSSFDNPPKRIVSGECSDENVLCPGWAATGECIKNPLYMVGTEDSHGFCLKSCGMCDS